MSKTQQLSIHLATFILALIFVLGSGLRDKDLIYLLSLPFAFVADIIKELSLGSTFGNVLAWIIYLVIIAIPILILLLLIKRKNFIKPDLLLIFISLVLGLGIYYLINPSENMTAASMIAISPLIESIIIAYVIIRIILKAQRDDLSLAPGYLRHLLIILFTAFVFMAYLCLLNTLINSQGTDALLEATNFLAALFSSIIYFMVARITKKVADLCLLYQKDRFDQKIRESLKAINRLSMRTLIVIVTVPIVLNALYVLLGSKLKEVNSSLTVPLLPLIFVLLGLFLMRLFEDLADLKNDNDLLI